MRVAVVGGGISGLTAAWRLTQRGADVVVYEPGRIGGRMSSKRVGPFQLDLGAHLLLENYHRTKALAREVGVADQWMPLVAEAAGGILHDHEPTSFAPDNVADMLRYGGLSPWSRVQLLRFILRARKHRDTLDFFDLSAGPDELDQQDAYTWSVAHYGEQIADGLFDPFVRTFHFHGADRMSMKYFDALGALFLQMKGGFSPRAFRGYMQALPDALAEGLTVRHAAVERVVTGQEQIQVDAGAASGRYDAVVLATTADVARRLLEPAIPAHSALLDTVDYSASIVCAFQVPTEVAGDFEGFWVPFQESAIISGIANETCKGSVSEGRTVFSVALNDVMARAFMDSADEGVLEAVATELGRLLPVYDGALVGLNVQRWPRAIPIYGVGYISRVKAYWQAGQGTDGVFLCGDYLNHPWVEGSVRCGEKVAFRVLELGS